MSITHEATDLRDDNSTTAVLAAGDTFYGTIGAAADRDWIAVDLVAGQTYSFAAVSVGQTPLSDPHLFLRDSDGVSVADNDDGLPNLNSLIIYTATTTGRYFLDMGDVDTATGDYGLTMDDDARPSFELEMIAGVLSHPDFFWDTTSLSFGFRTQGAWPNATQFYTAFSSSQNSSVVSIMGFFSDILDIGFSNRGYSNSATILFANYRDNDGAAAYAYLPGETIDSARNARSGEVYGDVWHNSYYFSGGYGFGTFFYEVMLHEIGHALGLTHPGHYDVAFGPVTYASDAAFEEDSTALTLMSYFEPSNTGQSDLYAQTLSIADIIALQNLYGANFSTRAGDTTYGFNATVGGIYNFDNNDTPRLTIWDGGGSDTLNLSDTSDPQMINLNQGTLSDVLGYIGNLGIAMGTVIENVIGGRGADTIFGNNVANSLFGGGGSDQLYGAAGNDTIKGDAGADTLDGGTGDDQLYGGAGDDIFYIDSSQDRINEGVGSGYDILYTSVSYALQFGLSIQEMHARDRAAIDLTGNEGTNRLFAGTGVNILTGGGGPDVFVFQDVADSTSSARDQIADFTHGLTRIDLSGIDANAGLAGAQSFGALGTTASANGLWWTALGTDVILFADVDGNSVADFELLILGVSSLDTADLIL